jgi:hypothetical protein
MKRMIILAVLAAGLFGGYSLWVAHDDIVLDESSPVVGVATEASDEPTVARDALDTMSDREKDEFMQAVLDVGDERTIVEERMPEQPSVIAAGDFVPRAHGVEGRALFIEGDGVRTLRFENFETINGPNLHIYLAADPNGDDIIDLGKIRATSGNVNYDIPEGVDLDRYRYALVWCVPFKVLFSYAVLVPNVRL